MFSSEIQREKLSITQVTEIAEKKKKDKSYIYCSIGLVLLTVKEWRSFEIKLEREREREREREQRAWKVAELIFWVSK